MKKASEVLVQKIKSLARPVSSAEDLHNIATIASGSAIMVSWAHWAQWVLSVVGGGEGGRERGDA
jgi:hypothetical protein